MISKRTLSCNGLREQRPAVLLQAGSPYTSDLGHGNARRPGVRDCLLKFAACAKVDAGYRDIRRKEGAIEEPICDIDNLPVPSTLLNKQWLMRKWGWKSFFDWSDQ